MKIGVFLSIKNHAVFDRAFLMEDSELVLKRYSLEVRA